VKNVVDAEMARQMNREGTRGKQLYLKLTTIQSPPGSLSSSRSGLHPAFFLFFLDYRVLTGARRRSSTLQRGNRSSFPPLPFYAHFRGSQQSV